MTADFLNANHSRYIASYRQSEPEIYAGELLEWLDGEIEQGVETRGVAVNLLTIA